MYEDSELNIFSKIKLLGEISSILLKNLLGINVHKTLESF